MQGDARRIVELGIPPSRWNAVVDPQANIADGVPAGSGSVASAITQTGPYSSMREHYFLRLGAIVSHDVSVADSVYLGQASVTGG